MLLGDLSNEDTQSKIVMKIFFDLGMGKRMILFDER